MLQKLSRCAKGGHKQNLYQQYDFPFDKSVANTNLKEHALSMDQDRDALNTNFFIILKICQ